MIASIQALWPIIKWALQSLGLMGPEDLEKEREYKIKLMEAAEKKDAALISAFADFQKLWRPPAERVYVWANTAIALFQPLLLSYLYWDATHGQKIVQLVAALAAMGTVGLVMIAIYGFPFYGPAFAPGIASAFSSAMAVAAKVVVGKTGNGKSGSSAPTDPEPVLPRRADKPSDRTIEELEGPGGLFGRNVKEMD